MFKRILKTLTALGAGHGVQTLTQLLLPPAFIAAYGIQGYGEWLALSAAVGYLTTLDFGLQTYVLNRLTALYHQGELKEFHRVQSVGLWLTLGFVALGALAASSAFVLPLGNWLRISGTRSSIAWTIFWLAFQVLAGIPLGQVLGIYRTFGQAHRGVMWGNGHRALLLVVTLAVACGRAPFWLVACAQSLVTVSVGMAALGSLRLSEPTLHPRLNYWRSSLAREMLKPSFFFGLFLLNNFLVYQAPVLLLQKFLGARLVVVFSVARTLFSFARQGAALLQQAIAPEIARLNGVGDHDKLVRLYLIFESLLCSGALIVNAALLILAPTLLALWLKQPRIFDLWIFVPVMLVSLLVTIKEYKLYFQYMTNQHVPSGLMTFISYSAMVLLSIPAIRCFGIEGFVCLWLVVETFQLIMVHIYNLRLFRARPEISFQPLLRLTGAVALLVGIVVPMDSYFQLKSHLWQAVTAALMVCILALISYFLFNLQTLVREGRERMATWRLDLKAAN